MKTLMFAALCSALLLGSCSKGEEYNCDANATNRVGAMCNDGTRSNATGSGACSHHGGVDYWICKD